jgi:predicted transport protein
MGIEDIEASKKLCRDISNIGRWGNGDVEVGLSNIDDLPYVMGLICQSFDHQMGGPQDA